MRLYRCRGPAAAAAAALAAAPRKCLRRHHGGGVIYQNLCGACHTSGGWHGPDPGQGAWTRVSPRARKPVQNAIEGFSGPDGGVMPPKGGNPALTDEQMQATVDWMLGNLK